MSSLTSGVDLMDEEDKLLAAQADRDNLLWQIHMLQGQLDEVVERADAAERRERQWQDCLDATRQERDRALNSRNKFEDEKMLLATVIEGHQTTIAEMNAKNDAYKRATVELAQQLAQAQAQLTREPSRTHLVSALRFAMANLQECPQSCPGGWVPSITETWEEDRDACFAILRDGIAQFNADNPQAVLAPPGDLVLSIEEGDDPNVTEK